MNEELKPILEERVDPELEKRELKRTYNRCGWILLIFCLLAFPLSYLIDVVLSGADEGIKEFLGKNALFINSAVVGIETLAVAFLLHFIPKAAPKHQKILPKEFFKFVFFAFGASCIGNLITQFSINFVYFITGIEISDKVSAAIGSVAPWQSFVCVVLIAPITEEFLFRKLIIDRLHKHGEYLAILTSAVFFGLFHQNVYQILPTAAAGLILGYLYCKTGSYLAVTLLHAIYNFVGVFPTIFNAKLTEFADLTAEELSALPVEIYAEYRAAMAGYIIFMLIVAAINIFGIVLLIINRNKFSTENNAPSLLESDKREIVVRAPGIVAAAVVMILLTVHSLFL